MAMNNPYAKYSNNAIQTASKEELTLMLYEGALKFTNQAIASIENKDFQKANDLIIRVQDIIREFQITLDDRYEISRNFHSMYDYLFRLLVDANIKKDIGVLKEARDYIREFRDMWKEAMKLSKHS